MLAVTIIAGLAIVVTATVCWFAVQTVQKQSADLLAAERARTADWWARSQRHIDNLQDRVMSKEFEVYAQASHVERPGDQPTFTAEGEYNAGKMASDLLAQLREEQQSYGEDPFDSVAEDYVGPTVG